MAKQVVRIKNRDLETYTYRNGRVYFDSFDTSEQLNDVVRDIEDWAVANNKRFHSVEFRNNTKTIMPDFHGTNDLNVLRNPNDIVQFNYPQRLDTALTEVLSIKQNLELGGGMKKKKLEMSSQPIGVFNFPAAAIGLYRKAEYFSPMDNAVVDKSLVQGNVDKGFFYTQNGQQKPLEQRQENTTEMLRINPNAVAKKTNSGMLYTDPIKYKNVMLKFGTTNRKVYLVKSEIKNIQNKGKEKYVDLYIRVYALGGIRPENVFYSALPSFAAAQILQDAGFKVRIHKLVIHRTRAEQFICYSTILKDYGDPIDSNKLFIQCGDPRIFRWTDFRNWGAFFIANFDADLGSGYGPQVDVDDLRRIFNDFRAWKRKKIEKGELREFNKNMRLHLYAAMNATNDDEATQIQNAENALKFLLDSVAVEFSGSEQAIKDAIQRDIAKTPKQSIIRNFENNLRDATSLPQQPSDGDLHIPDSEFQTILANYNKNVQEFNQIKPTL
jgi:hypothetical protein